MDHHDVTAMSPLDDPRGNEESESGKVPVEKTPLPHGRGPEKTNFVRRTGVAIAFAVIVTLLAVLPGRAAIPPLVESDYCYQLIAVDRAYNGLGLTAPQPVAPHQAWEWHFEWDYLTQWPPAYAIMIYATRVVTGVGTLGACRIISVLACAAALVGWFVWIRRSLPKGLASWLAAAVAAALAMPTASLINPSTDALLIALLPWVLLLIARAVRAEGDDSDVNRRTGTLAWFLLGGLACGMLVWVRYAAIFVPAAVGLYLLIEQRRRSVGWRQVFGYAIGAAIPILAILFVNRTLGASPSIQAHLNLGSQVAFGLTPELLRTAWVNLTNLGFYDYRPPVHWLIALSPLLLLLAAVWRPAARAMRNHFAAPPNLINLCLVLTLLTMLVGATAVFGDKFDYAGLDRYYLPGRPIYFALIVGPLLLLRHKAPRIVTCAGLMLAASWIAQVEWQRPYQRWIAADRPSTPYGQLSRCFEPGADALYAWIEGQVNSELILVSNFHEYLALETGQSTLPIPPDARALDKWVEKIADARGVLNPRVLFVLDPSNRWREYWIPEPASVVRRFGLRPSGSAEAGVAKYVFDYSPTSAGLMTAIAHNELTVE